VSHQWAGLAAIAVPSATGYYNIDSEFVTPDGASSIVGSSGYPTAGNCPPQQ